MMRITCILLFICMSYCAIIESNFLRSNRLIQLKSGSPIDWIQNISVGVSQESGWGRLLTTSSNLLVTWSEYNTSMPNGCVTGWTKPGPIVWVAKGDYNNLNSWNIIGWIDSPAGHIQEQSILLQLSTGRILMAMRNRQPDCNWFGLPVLASDDGGQTWSFISQLDQTTIPTGQFNRGLWEPFLFQLPNGQIAGFYADETHANQGWNQIVGERVSADGGQTWSNEIFASALQDGVSRPGMPGVAQLVNGSVILVFEVCGTDNCNIHFKLSDDGINWPTGLGTMIANQVSGPYVQVSTSGRIFVTSACTNVVSISDDNGNSWYTNSANPYSQYCSNGNYPYTWPAIYNLGSDQIGVVATGVVSQVSIVLGQYLT